MSTKFPQSRILIGAVILGTAALIVGSLIWRLSFPASKWLQAGATTGPHAADRAPDSSEAAIKQTPPPNASPEMKEFMENRAKLLDAMSKMRGQNTTSADLTQFHQQNETLLKRQAELARQMAAQQDQKPLAEPPPLTLPPNVTPELQAFLTTRDKVMRSRIEMMNLYRTADPKTRQAAMQDWQQKNASLLQQMRDQAQALAKTNSK